MKNYTKNNNLQTQNGSALIISLIILLVMTILGIQGMQSSALEEKMASNYRDRAMAFEAAEAALVAGEAWLDQESEPPVADNSGSSNVWTFGSPDINDSTVWASSGINAATSLTVGASSFSEAPKYIIEERGLGSSKPDAESGEITHDTANQAYRYRITARGVGTSPNSVVILQSNYEKNYSVAVTAP